RLVERGIEDQTIPLQWEETVAACLAKEPSRRPQSAMDVLRRLEARQGFAAQEPAPGGEPKRSRKGMLVLGSVMLAVVAVVLALPFLKQRGTNVEVETNAADPLLVSTAAVSHPIEAKVDPAFNPGSGADGSVLSRTIQPDGKLLLSGSFQRFNGVRRKSICRLNADGSVDETFAPVVDNTVHGVALAPDGKIVIVGGFTTVNGHTSKTVARLHPDGSVDKSFSTGHGGDLEARSVAVQADGKILVGGSFVRFNNLVRNRIVRLNTDGSVDPTFDAKQGANDIIWHIWPRADGKILVGGKFTQFAGKPCSFVQLTANGEIDREANLVQGPNRQVTSCLEQPDGKVIISGDFTSFEGVMTRVVRLNPDCSIDRSFHPVSLDSGKVRIASDPTGALLVAGSFKGANGFLRRGFARYSKDGVIDPGFDVIRDIDGSIAKVMTQSPGQIIIAGNFTRVNGIERKGFARISFGKDSSVGLAATKNDFIPLFNGKDLTGWQPMTHIDPRKVSAMAPETRANQKLQCKACGKSTTWAEDFKKHWRVENGELVNDGHGPYATTDRDYSDIELKLEYKTVPRADSGVYLRGSPQVQIWDHTETEKFKHGADKGSGGLWNNSPGTRGKDPLVLADKPFGEWNKLRIIQAGDITTVYLNDRLVVDHARMENFWDRKQPLFASGPIQLQTHGGEIRWRNIYLRELSAEESAATKAKGAALAAQK
ncbi:MAG: family 16 glycoside hydrolase, partial [Limisphaerales bacterium]